jgi:Tol biopolymer transport system component
MKPERWQHIDKLLGEALELEAGRPGAFLDQACGNDEELRRKINSLLAAHEQADSFIEAPALAGMARSLADEARSMVGRQLGHYQVLALVGAGGMGAVWKAKDTRLDREVAIKTLPAEFERHTDRLARFEREAKLLASLNHPNIASIHGLDEDRGTRFLVLELVEGETLAYRLGHGAIPLEESLKFARQISAALEAAHEKGVIHRDLKPANIKITADGTVKILDFGLAKAFARDDVQVDPADSSSSNIESTEPGMILGTGAYMAPEQTRGKKVDRRADIWAFGVVLYEMVTGRRPFQGADSTETMASIVTKEPDFDAAPAPVRRLLQKCLEKDPKNRLRDIGDVWELLNNPTVTADTSHPHAGRRDAALLWMMASVLAIVVALVFAFLWLKPLPLPEVVRFQIQAPARSRLPLGTPAISNDGRTLAYTVVDRDGVTRIYVRALDGVETRPLPGTEGAVHPIWSPGGDSLAFVAGRRLRRIDLSGRSVGDLIGTGFPLQVTWNQYDDILLRVGQELVRVSAQGGLPTPIPNSSGTAFPAFLSDGRRFLMRVGSDNRYSIQLGALGSAERTLVVDNVLSAPVLAPTPRGKTYLLFLRESDLMAQEFDEASGKVLGNPALLVPRIGQVGIPAVRPAVGVSPSGILAYQNAGEAMTRRLTFVDRSGLPLRTLSPEVSVERPRLSPDQLSVVGTRPSGGQDIWVTDLVRESADRKTFADTLENFAVWSKDGSRIAFLRVQSGIYAIDVKGDGKPKLLTETPGIPTSWSDQCLLYTFPGPPYGKIYLLDVANGKKPIPVGSPNGYSGSGEFSPDGNYIAFHSDKSGRDQVYVQPAPPATGETPVSINGGRVPRWRGDGKEIFFVSPDGDLMAVDIKLGRAISVGTPHKLFRFNNRDAYDVGGIYDVDKDGKRFLSASHGEEEQNAPITVVLNWWVEWEKRLGR